ncbi:hypothetical protein MYRA21_0066 [Myroides sp. A21]|uniref:hypothetical protein n=1 Tax=Myroides sp. A21 TaxID=1583100 RepID=UPI00057C3935|nr:hypothetical protein [Myroides sp. A21]AJA67310.1 hypothetical protein MYRA21_0066 [Myroides sp. A21]
MKRKTVVISNQSLLDVALVEYGSVLAVFDLALNNNLSITDTVPAGTELKLIATDEMDVNVQDYCIRKSLNIATMSELDESMRGFDFILANLIPNI